MLIKEKLKNPHVDNEFLNSIAESTSQKFSTNFIQKLFQKVKQIDYIMLFESFVEYTADKKLKTKHIDFDMDTFKISDLLKLTKLNDYLEIIRSKNLIDCLICLNKLAVKNKFEGKMKNSIELLEELINLNQNDSKLVCYIESQLQKDLNLIKGESFK